MKRLVTQKKLTKIMVILVLLLGLLPIGGTVFAAHEVYINEIQVNTSGTDWEFFELQGAAGTDLSSLTLIGIESDAGTAAGTIDLVISLAGQSIPADGFWLGMSPAGATAYSVTGELSISDNSFENSTATYFLVSNFTGSAGSDLDGDNNGTLDSMPWDEIVDSINLRDSTSDFDYGAPSVGPDGSFLPSGTYRCPDAPSGSFTNIHNFGNPDGTPGAANDCGGAVEPVINEFSASTTGTDVEYVELYGEADTDYSAYTILEIEGDSSGPGVVDEVIAMGTTDSSGFYLVNLPANALENGTISLLLVKNFTGAVGDDLDTDNDGTFDVTPWEAIVDSVAVNDGGAGDVMYSSVVLGPNYDGLSSFAPGGASRIPDGLDTDTASDWVRNDFDLAGISGFTGTPIEGEALNTPGAMNEVYVAPPPAVLSVKIHEVQGSGETSPLVGSTVIVEGIVVGDFQDGAAGMNGDLNGFFLQEEDSDADSDAMTSEGIFIFDGNSPAIDVAIGDLVQVEGEVSEFNGLTEITSFSGVTVVSSANPLPTVTMLSLPAASLDAFEAYEGMYVTFPQALVISEYFNFDRFGEIVLTADRQFQPTAIYEPGSPEAAALLAQNLLSRITLDDGRTISNPDPAYHPDGSIFDLDNRFRGGDTVSSLTGVMHYAFGLYRIQPTDWGVYTSENPRPASPPDVGGTLKVASFNVLNYFTTFGSRGADNAAEFERQSAKIVAALSEIDADVVGLMEIENNTAAIQDLVDKLNTAMGAGTYAYVDTGVIGTDEIKVAFIYKPATVSLVGDYAILDSSVDARFLDDYNRPVLAQTFLDSDTGGIFTAAVNHLKSKGSACDAVGDPDTGGGAGNCNLTRLAAAEALVDWLATDPTGSGDEDFLIIGDLNSYDKEDPIDAIKEGADDVLGTGDDYTDLLYQFIGEYAYTYVFDGQLGYLDHALAIDSLMDEVTGAAVWHINADEPDIIDYDTSFKKAAQDALYEPNAFRSSDHDPVLVGLDMCADFTAPTLEITLTPDMLWPANHKYVDVTAMVIATDNFDPDPVVTLISVVSDEDDEGLGDGDFPNDIVIIDDYTFQLRAERSAITQIGRTYTITYQVVDECGNVTVGSATVFVPFSLKKD